MSQCAAKGCNKIGKTRKGYCNTHYMRLWRTGQVDEVSPPGIPGDNRKHRLYGAWAGMVNRCHNPNNSSYDRYGARGVTVCDRWRFGEDGLSGFACYLADMGERPEGMTLDRIDGKRGYSPDNCRWATIKEQRANITPEGDQRMRKAMSIGVKKYWANRREMLCEGVPTGTPEPAAVTQR